MPVTYQSALSACQMVRFLAGISQRRADRGGRGRLGTAKTWPQEGSSRTQRHVTSGRYREAQLGHVSQLSGRDRQSGMQRPRTVCVHEPQGSEWEGGLVEAAQELRKDGLQRLRSESIVKTGNKDVAGM